MVQIKLSSGQSGEVTWDNTEHTVGELRQIVSAKFGLDLEGSRFVHRGQVMEDDFPTSKYGVTMSSVVFVVVKNPKASTTIQNPVATEEDSEKETRSPEMPRTNPPMFPGFGGMGAGSGGGFPGFGGLNMEAMAEMMSDPSMVNAMAQNNPMLANLLSSNPRLGELITNPNYVKLAMRMMSDPVMSRVISSGDMAGMANPEIVSHFQQIVREEMPELYGMMMPGMLGGGFPGMFAGLGAGAGAAGTTGATGATSGAGAGFQPPRPTAGPQQRQPIHVGKHRDEEESDDALDDVYDSDTAASTPFNSFGQKEAISKFVEAMLVPKSPSDKSPNGTKESGLAASDTSVEAMDTQGSQIANGQAAADVPMMEEPSREELMDKYKTQIDTLHSMGFFDDDKSLRLLRITGGDVNSTVDRLLSEI